MSVTAFPLEQRIGPSDHRYREAIERKRRLWTPPNGRVSDETEILSAPALRKLPSVPPPPPEPPAIDPPGAIIHQYPQASVAAEVPYIPSAFASREMDEPPLIDGETVYPTTVRDIARAACRVFNVSMIDMVSARRTRKIVLPRQITMYLAREMTTASLPRIGRLIGNKDHTTVLHGCQKIAALVLTSEETASQVEAVRWEATVGRRRAAEQPVTG